MYDELKRLGHVQYTFIENEGNPPNKLQSVNNDLKFIEKLLKNKETNVSLEPA